LQHGRTLYCFRRGLCVHHFAHYRDFFPRRLGGLSLPLTSFSPLSFSHSLLITLFFILLSFIFVTLSLSPLSFSRSLLITFFFSLLTLSIIFSFSISLSFFLLSPLSLSHSIYLYLLSLSLYLSFSLPFCTSGQMMQLYRGLEIKFEDLLSFVSHSKQFSLHHGFRQELDLMI